MRETLFANAKTSAYQNVNILKMPQNQADIFFHDKN